MEQQIIDCISRVFSESNDILLSTLWSRLNNISKKQRTYLKKFGIEKFVTSHPNHFAVIDGHVILLPPPVEQFPLLDLNEPVNNSSTSASNIQSEIKFSSNSLKDVSPSHATVESIKKDMEKHNSCLVCSEDMDVYAIGFCFHPICFKCATKLRVLCGDKLCPVCRSELDQVTFTKDLLPMDQVDSLSFIKEQKYGLVFQSARILDMHKALLEHTCNKINCVQSYKDFDDLKYHMKQKHREYFCDICLKQCKMFTRDRVTYSTIELKEHMEKGDEGQGSAHQGHPLCKFCDHRYLDRDELLRHLQQHHCSCHICNHTGHVFYADTTELWEHYISEHHACLHTDCYLRDRYSVFDAEEKLQAHNNKKHVSKKGKSTKRLEQPVLLDVNFGSQGGLQFDSPTLSNSASKSFELPPSRVPTLAVSPDGSIRCKGTVTNVTSYYGFIQPDSSSGEFSDNVFFNKQSFGLDEEDDLETHLPAGTRVFVLAQPSQYPRSKWRAVHVTLGGESLSVEASEDHGVLHEKNNIKEAIPSSQRIIEVELRKDDSFPALSSGGNPHSVLSSTPGNWNRIIGTKKTQPEPVARPLISPLQTVKPKQKSLVKASSLEGIGYVHYRLEPKFGFLTRPNTAFEDNIFFNLQAYQVGMQDIYVQDLTTVLKANDKACYLLEEPGKIQRQTKAKYRAEKIWKSDGNEGEGTSNCPTTSSMPSKVINGTQPSKHPVKSPSNGQLDVSLSSIKNSPHKQKKHCSLSEDSWTKVASTKKIRSIISGAAVTRPPDEAMDQSYINTSLDMGLDTFDVPPIADCIENLASHGNDEVEIFRCILGEIIGGDPHESLFEFDTELEIAQLPIRHIAFIHFILNRAPRVFSVFLASPTLQSPRYRTFDMTAFRGFQQNVMEILRKKGLVIKTTEDVYYINGSSIYVMLRRNDRGVVQELHLHTSFGKA